MAKTQFAVLMGKIANAWVKKRIDRAYLNRMVESINARRGRKSGRIVSIIEVHCNPHDLDHAVRLMKKDGHW